MQDLNFTNVVEMNKTPDKRKYPGKSGNEPKIRKKRTFKKHQ